MGLLPVFQEEIIHRAIELNHVTVREIMTPRGKIFSLPADMPLEQATARIVEEQHSRIPVYDPASGPEHIIGVVYSKDISRLMHFRTVALSLGGQGESGLTLRQVMHEITVVPETKLAVELLQEFQERRRQIAIVVDEFGSTVGIVTAEDILEQVVGELDDEFDIAASPTPQHHRSHVARRQHHPPRPRHPAPLDLPPRGRRRNPRRIPPRPARPHPHRRRDPRLRRPPLHQSPRWPATASPASTSKTIVPPDCRRRITRTQTSTEATA